VKTVSFEEGQSVRGGVGGIDVEMETATVVEELAVLGVEAVDGLPLCQS